MYHTSAGLMHATDREGERKKRLILFEKRWPSKLDGKNSSKFANFCEVVKVQFHLACDALGFPHCKVRFSMQTGCFF